MKELRNKNLRISILKILKRIGMFFLAINLMGVSNSSDIVEQHEMSDSQHKWEVFDQFLNTYFQAVKWEMIVSDSDRVSLTKLQELLDVHGDRAQYNDEDLFSNFTDILNSYKNVKKLDRGNIRQMKQNMKLLLGKINETTDKKLSAIGNKKEISKLGTGKGIEFFSSITQLCRGMFNKH